MSTSDSSQPSGQTSSQPSASATTPAAAAPAAAPAVAAGTPAAPASTDSATPVAVSGTTAATTDAGSTTPPATGETQGAPAAAAPPVTPPAGAPEKYEFKMPEGDTYKGLSLDPSLVGAMSPVLKAANLTQAQADTLVKAFIDHQMGAPKAQLSRDLEVTMKDPVLGGMNWGQTQGHVNEALAAFTTPEFRAKLERWGIANNVEFVRVFSAVGRAMRGDSPAPRSPNTAGEMSLADKIYSRAKKVSIAE